MGVSLMSVVVLTAAVAPSTCFLQAMCQLRGPAGCPEIWWPGWLFVVLAVPGGCARVRHLYQPGRSRCTRCSVSAQCKRQHGAEALRASIDFYNGQKKQDPYRPAQGDSHDRTWHCQIRRPVAPGPPRAVPARCAARGSAARIAGARVALVGGAASRCQAGCLRHAPARPAASLALRVERATEHQHQLLAHARPVNWIPAWTDARQWQCAAAGRCRWPAAACAWGDPGFMTRAERRRH